MIIGISGKKQSGKDTICKIIQYLMFKNQCQKTANWTYEEFISPNNRIDTDLVSGFHRKLFADKLKQIVCLLIGCTREQLEDREFKEKELEEEWWYYQRVRNKKGFDSFNYDLLSYTENKQHYENETHQLVKLTPRLLLQLLGTDCGRDIIHPNIWVNALMSEYKKELHDCGEGKYGKVKCNLLPNWIVTDVRFENEAKAIKDRRGLLFRIEKEDRQNPCKYCGKSIREQVKGCSEVVCYRQYINNKKDKHESETVLDNYVGWDALIVNNSSIEDLTSVVKTYLEKLKII